MMLYFGNAHQKAKQNSILPDGPQQVLLKLVYALFVVPCSCRVRRNDFRQIANPVELTVVLAIEAHAATLADAILIIPYRDR